jgi:hypothetical protein
MARSDEKMEHNWRIKGNNLINVVRETESTLNDENCDNLLHYIQLIEILLQNIS